MIESGRGLEIRGLDIQLGEWNDIKELLERRELPSGDGRWVDTLLFAASQAYGNLGVDFDSLLANNNIVVGNLHRLIVELDAFRRACYTSVNPEDLKYFQELQLWLARRLAERVEVSFLKPPITTYSIKEKKGFFVSKFEGQFARVELNLPGRSLNIVEFGPGMNYVWLLNRLVKDGSISRIGKLHLVEIGDYVPKFLQAWVEKIGLQDKVVVYREGIRKVVSQLCEEGWEDKIDVIVASSVGVAGREEFRKGMEEGKRLLASNGYFVIFEGVVLYYDGRSIPGLEGYLDSNYANVNWCEEVGREIFGDSFTKKQAGRLKRKDQVDVVFRLLVFQKR